MPQSSAQRKYWAERKKRENSTWRKQIDKLIPDIKPKQPRPETVLLATNLQEYKELQRDYPNMRIRLDTEAQPQLHLFDTLGLRDV